VDLDPISLTGSRSFNEKTHAKICKVLPQPPTVKASLGEWMELSQSSLDCPSFWFIYMEVSQILVPPNHPF
jgi:hypothetical protein